jgi:hypothetical protein
LFAESNNVIAGALSPSFKFYAFKYMTRQNRKTEKNREKEKIIYKIVRNIVEEEKDV